ncbi:MAG: 4Fe-4S binding protein [Clostridia bacterium]|nr:4Fe-4S binding protein [Clostridia bacterium]
MIDLRTTIAGLAWRTPLAISAGPLTRNTQEILLATEQRGLGAIITKTIYYNDALTPKPTMVKVDNNLVNYDWSGTKIDTWEEYFRQLDKQAVPIIASMFDASPERMAEMARRLEAVGAQAIEVPLDAGLPLAELVKRVEVLKKTVKMPLICKLGPSLPDTRKYAKALEEAGADAFAGINTIGPVLVLDKDGYPYLGNSFGHGYLSGPAIKGIALRTIAEIASAVKVPVIGGGGIMSARDILDYVMVGASGVFVHTAVIFKGLKVLDKLVDELVDLMKEKGLESLDQIRGKSQEYLVDGTRMETKVPIINEMLCNGCGLCVRSCIYHSLFLEGKKLRQDKDKCFGCGLCVSICPKEALSL